MGEFKRAVFHIDSIAQRKFPGLTDGDDWNGWACPYFEKETAEDVLRASEKNGFQWEYGADTDTYFVRNETDNVDEEPETYTGIDVQFDGQPIHVYPIGAYVWIWDQSES